MVRAKFIVENQLVTKYQGGEQTEIVMSAIDNSNTPENKSFCEFTPSGKLTMLCTNPDVIAEMQPGKTFYVDFTETEE